MAASVLAIAGASCSESARNVDESRVPAPNSGFVIEEATIPDIQGAIIEGRLTTTTLVRMYLDRIKGYNGPCVHQPDGVRGVIAPMKNAGNLNALMTLNLRLATRRSMGFDDGKARSTTDDVDGDPAMPDALEVAAALDAHFSETGRLIGPLHGVVVAIKDQYDTFDMRTTNGMDTPYANDRPPSDATVVKRLRDAGAIILAKANMGESATGTHRSSFGGAMCNPYDTERTPGLSSGGSSAAVAANLVTCSIGESTGGSIVWPASSTNIVGIEPTQELVSRRGMIGQGLNTRTGPMCRTVADAARLLDVIAGYDPLDEQTAFSVGRRPQESYASFTTDSQLGGVRVGVVREYMNKALFTAADAQSIDIAERAIRDLAEVGATVVDPGADGALFQECVIKYAPLYRNRLFTEQFPKLFPEGADHIGILVDMFVNPSGVPGEVSIRHLGPAPTTGEEKYYLTRYLKERGDANIRTIEDLVNKSTFYSDIRPNARMADRKAALEATARASTLDNRNRILQRFAYQQIVLQCMATMDLDVLAFPTGNIPPPIIGAPTEPTVNGRIPANWGTLPQQGFPVISVPAGFTTEVFDRVPDPTAPGGNRLHGPVPAKLPVGISFLARPFDESTLFRVAAAYEAATHHRVAPPAFGPVASSRPVPEFGNNGVVDLYKGLEGPPPNDGDIGCFAPSTKQRAS